MANEFKIKKGLIVEGASDTEVNAYLKLTSGNVGIGRLNRSPLCQIVSGVPIFEVNSSGLSTFDRLSIWYNTG